MSKKIRKKNGRRERYRESKLVLSLVKAGLDKHTARSVAESLRVKNGMYTREIKCRIFDYLDEIDPEIAQRYFSTMGMKVTAETFDVNGYALMSPETMKDLEIRPGDTIDIFNGNRSETERVFPGKGIRKAGETLSISHHDMHNIGVHDGSRVAVRKHYGFALASMV
ncbi:MAG: hypothetical protein ACMUFK_03555 [Thermoplasmatota archaeon]